MITVVAYHSDDIVPLALGLNLEHSSQQDFFAEEFLTRRFEGIGIHLAPKSSTVTVVLVAQHAPYVRLAKKMSRRSRHKRTVESRSDLVRKV